MAHKKFESLKATQTSIRFISRKERKSIHTWGKVGNPFFPHTERHRCVRRLGLIPIHLNCHPLRADRKWPGNGKMQIKVCVGLRFTTRLTKGCLGRLVRVLHKCKHRAAKTLACAENFRRTYFTILLLKSCLFSFICFSEPPNNHRMECGTFIAAERGAESMGDVRTQSGPVKKFFSLFGRPRRVEGSKWCSILFWSHETVKVLMSLERGVKEAIGQSVGNIGHGQ